MKNHINYSTLEIKMNTELMFNFRTMTQRERKNWDFTCAWAVFYVSKQLSFELKYIGPDRLFKKRPANCWINESDIEFVWVNVPTEEDEEDNE